MSNTPPNNPYAKAAGAYGDNAQKNTPDQRELEGRVLLKAAGMIKDLQKNWETAKNDTDLLEATLKYNRQIWMMFYDTAIENNDGDRPDDLRSNIINLANFIFKRETEILADRERDVTKLDVLVNINKEIASGLIGKATISSAPAQTPDALLSGNNAPEATHENSKHESVSKTQNTQSINTENV
ncbi:MAG: flagellar biosynthesis regulator FlaF [Alphaproteobacteria bacterium]